ncbi:MAG: mannitol/fructose-specific phosphotransferase system IIA component (Ntr-type) [Rhodothermales bacterium]
MYLTDLLSPNTIRVGLLGTDKNEIIGQTIDLLADSEFVTDLEVVRNVVMGREAQMSTGVGKGLGLPHGKTSAATGSVAALSVTAEPIEFDAFDGEPVRIVFLLVGPPEAQTLHIRTLSRISRIMNSGATRKLVLEATSPEEVYQAIHQAEEVLLEARV